jgi:hypothetical protein
MVLKGAGDDVNAASGRRARGALSLAYGDRACDDRMALTTLADEDANAAASGETGAEGAEGRVREPGALAPALKRPRGFHDPVRSFAITARPPPTTPTVRSTSFIE